MANTLTVTLGAATVATVAGVYPKPSGLPTANSRKATTIDSQVTGGVYSPATTPATLAILASLRTAGILTPAGVYAAGKSKADIETFLTTPGINQDALRHATDILGI